MELLAPDTDAALFFLAIAGLVATLVAILRDTRIRRRSLGAV